MTPLGPVSAVLAAELQTKIRRRGVLVWLDVDSHYTRFVDALKARREAGELGYEVAGFRGSHLELMLALEDAAAGVDRSQLLVHMPGFSRESVRKTPMLELYAAGTEYRKHLERLVTDAASGRVAPDQIQAFCGQGGLSLEGADAWLSAQLNLDAGGGLVGQLRTVPMPALVDDLLAGAYYAQRLRMPGAMDGIWPLLEARVGLRDEWHHEALRHDRVRPRDVAFAVSSWALAVEYVHDLRRPPVQDKLGSIPGLPGGVVETCRELAQHLRERHASFYQRTADETEGWIAQEVDAADAHDLGRIDTFRFEENEVLRAALRALGDEQWSTVREWTEARLGEGSFWLRIDPSRRSAWELVRDAVTLGETLVAAGPSLNAATLDGALDRYSAVGAAVDQAHRHLEQRRTALLFPQLPEFETLRATLDGLRERWRTWADDWARDFNTVCKREGFLPPSSLQQRTLFDEVVVPSTKEAGTTALFVVDAFRFEMAEELFRAIDGTPATSAHLHPRLAELPTVTEVGMNVLAPVTRRGRLTPAIRGSSIEGFSTGDFRVSRPDTRKRAMADRVGGKTCPWLKLGEVLDRDTTSLKQSVSQARLVVVHSIEIDSAGEKGVGPAVFDHVMQKLRAAWRLLREAGVRRFVFTADHGFLLLDETARRAIPHGRKIDPSRRHVLSSVGADHTGEVRVPMSELGYEDSDGLHLMFPESTAVFDTGNRGMSFVHGGNSLQERVIPVLTVVHRAAAGSDTVRYEVSAEARDGVAQMHCLSGQLKVQTQVQLLFGGTREVELSLRVVDQPEATVELCQVRGGARQTGGSFQATVGERFELFFKLSGPSGARVQVELFHPAAVAEVTPSIPATRFAVSGTEGAAPAAESAQAGTDWLDHFEGGVRQFFEHLAAHGAVTETEAQTMLGGARAVRRFSRHFEKHAAIAPFDIRIDSVGGVKRYVREGSN